jgi:hypothetical protein
MEALPYEITEAMIQCFGKAFHLKDAMASFLIQAGVDRTLVEKYRPDMKFPWARKVLTDLGQTEEGRLVQRRVLMALCQLRGLPDQTVEDRDAGLDALRRLKQLARDLDLVAREEKNQAVDKSRLAEEQARLRRDRAKKLEELRQRFVTGLSNPDRQEAGYDLEDVLADLFRLSEIEYRRSFRTETQQIDGHFKFEAFDYLVEAKWRKGQPTQAEMGGFKEKVSDKLESTRGLFVSIPGFRPEVVERFNGHGAKIIFMDGMHLTHILEGRIDLADALRRMIEAAAQKGLVYTALF